MRAPALFFFCVVFVCERELFAFICCCCCFFSFFFRLFLFGKNYDQVQWNINGLNEMKNNNNICFARAFSGKFYTRIFDVIALKFVLAFVKSVARGVRELVCLFLSVRLRSFFFIYSENDYFFFSYEWMEWPLVYDNIVPFRTLCTLYLTKSYAVCTQSQDYAGSTHVLQRHFSICVCSVAGVCVQYTQSVGRSNHK